MVCAFVENFVPMVQMLPIPQIFFVTNVSFFNSFYICSPTNMLCFNFALGSKENFLQIYVPKSVKLITICRGKSTNARCGPFVPTIRYLNVEGVSANNICLINQLATTQGTYHYCTRD